MDEELWFEEEIFPAAMTAADVAKMCIRDSLFDAAGLPYPADDWTYDDYQAAMSALTADTDGDGAADVLSLIHI